MEYLKASELTFNPRPQMARIFVEGFYEHGFQHFSKDRIKLANAMAHIFVLSNFYVAVENEEIMAFIGCTAKKPPPIKLDKKVLVQELGFMRGRITYWALNKYMINQAYPFELTPQTGSIEFVATAPEHRGKGVASGLLAHVMEVSPFEEYVLEVADNNPTAIRVYERLGFSEFMRKPAPKVSGIKFSIYMKK